MKIGIFGGTFNPTHIGHISAAISTLHQLNLDLLLVVPTGIPPHKEMPAGSPSGEERYEMASRAFQDIGQVKICDIELKRKGKSYTSDTIDWVMSQYPGADLWLLVGTDMLSCMEIWKDHDWILKNVRLAAFRAAKVRRRIFKKWPKTSAEIPVPGLP
jgi:nicotinate-nucleotide adenylyltransferase